MKTEFLIILDNQITSVAATKLCIEKSEELLGVTVSGEAPSAVDMSAACNKDFETFAEHGLKIQMVCRGMRSDDGFSAYAEPELFKEVPEGFVPTERFSVPAEMSVDNSLHIRRYYIRFSGDSGGWLDIVTRESWGDGVLTMPVSAKAVHNWARHARVLDPNVFITGLD